ncbi:MAG TPA: multicopper oxidase domain-containing protein [Terrimicrobiaceae bacterium]
MTGYFSGIVGLFFLFNIAIAANSEPVRLFVKEVPLKILGREVSVVSIEQADGTPGYSPEQAEGFHVEVVNQLKVPTGIHWHGSVLPNLMDGVPFVTQKPIEPGRSYRYDFPLRQSGTYWMHSHYGLQEQLFNSAPMIIWTAEELAKADRQVVVMLSDFSFIPPGTILANLKAGMQMPAMESKPSETMKMDSTAKMSKMADSVPGEVIAQEWDDQKQRFVRATVRRASAEVDVSYDALVANRRTLDDPELVPVTPGETALLRLIAASSATNFYIDTGALEAEVLAVDGKAVQPIKGSFFQLGIAQRIDLRVTIPKEGGAFPIVAQGEGTKLLCGVVLQSEGAALPKLSPEAAMSTASLDNTQEKRLRAMTPLVARDAQRTLPATLSGDMKTYVWKINQEAYPNRDSLDIQSGERVQIIFANETTMAHPMHLHGHDFEVQEIDGEKVTGPIRDTVVVPPNSKITIAFDANNLGIWALHCHLLYHLITGMFTVLKYDGADIEFWQPEKQASELKH